MTSEPTKNAAYRRERPREETEARLLRERGTPEELIGPVVPDGTLWPDASAAWSPNWTLPPAPAGDDEHLVEALYEAHVRTLGKDAIRQPGWDRLPEWKRQSWRREYRDV